jgi:prophage regulatory protein
MAKSVLRLSEVIEQTKLSRSTIYAYINRGIFPPATRVGIRAVRWESEAITKWLADRIDASRNTPNT